MMDTLSRSLGEKYVVYDVCYSQVGLLSYRVDELRDMTSLIKELEKSASLSRQMRKFDKLARGEEPQRKPKRQRTASAAANKVRRKKADNDKSDEPSGLIPASSGSSSSSSSSRESEGFEFEPVPGDMACDFVGEAGADGPPLAPPAAPQGPRYDQASGRAYGPDGTSWGRITVIRPGEASEAISVYCNRHGCQLCKRVAAAPGHSEILAWFTAGQTVPAGRKSALQSHHKARWPR